MAVDAVLMTCLRGALTVCLRDGCTYVRVTDALDGTPYALTRLRYDECALQREALHDDWTDGLCGKWRVLEARTRDGVPYVEPITLYASTSARFWAEACGRDGLGAVAAALQARA